MTTLHKNLIRIITDFAYNIPLSYDQLLVDFNRIADVKESIPAIFLSVMCYCEKNEACIPSPYHEFYPYYPLIFLKQDYIWSDFLLYLHGFLTESYFQHRYRKPLEKKIKTLYNSGLRRYNEMYFKLFEKLKRTDFTTEHQNLFVNFHRLKPLQSSVADSF